MPTRISNAGRPSRAVNGRPLPPGATFVKHSDFVRGRPVAYTVEPPLPSYTPPPYEIISHERWMRETRIGVGVQWRSTALKGVDDALLKYDRDKTAANMWALKHAFDAWKRSKKGDWFHSRRNDTHWAPRLLDDYLSEWGKHQPGIRFESEEQEREEREAIRFWATERKQAIDRIFRGTKIHSRTNRPSAYKGFVGELKELREELLYHLKEANLLVKNPQCRQFTLEEFEKFGPGDYKGEYFDENFARQGFSSREDFVRKMLRGMESLFSLNGAIDVASDVGDSAKLGLFVVKQMIEDLIPAFSIARTGYATALKIVKFARQSKQRWEVSKLGYVFDDGTPTLAFEGILQCLDRDLQTQKALMIYSGASLTVALIGLFPPAHFVTAPLTAACNVFAKTVAYLYEYGREIKETRAFNRARKAGMYDYRMFRINPLLACYFVVSCSTSDLIPLDCFGKPGWMEFVNTEKDLLDKVWAQADRLIRRSHFEIRGLPKRRVPNGTFNLFEKRKGVLAALTPLRKFDDALRNNALENFDS